MTNKEIDYLQSIVNKIMRFLSIAEKENEEKSKSFKVVKFPVPEIVGGQDNDK